MKALAPASLVGETGSKTSSGAMNRIPELDGLRGCAVLGIVFFHYSYPSFVYDRLGYVGSISLELFFVLSGFLITSIVLRHHERPAFLKNFYFRRGLRIWPLYYLVLACVLLLCAFRPRIYPLNGLAYYVVYLQNLPFYWFKTPANFAYPFELTWSLAIEEQFYILWPLAIWLIGPRSTRPLAVLAVAVALAARIIGFHEHILLARCDGFALGGLLAALLEKRESFDAQKRRATRRARSSVFCF